MMKYIRLVLGIIVGLLVITVVVETIEFFIVKIVSKQSFSYLSIHQEEYFQIRNTNWILISKLIYSFLAAIIGGYLSSKIVQYFAFWNLIILTTLQVVFILFAGFISQELQVTAPKWLWISLLFLLPIGITVGYKIWEIKSKSYA